MRGDPPVEFYHARGEQIVDCFFDYFFIWRKCGSRRTYRRAPGDRNCGTAGSARAHGTRTIRPAARGGYGTTVGNTPGRRPAQSAGQVRTSTRATTSHDQTTAGMTT